MHLCMYIVPFSIECIYWSLRLLYWVSCLWKFVCELSRDYHLLVSILLYILRVRDKWPFPRDSRSLSSPSLHTLVNWLFFMAWFEWIIHIGHPQIHGLWGSLYRMHFIHEGMRFHIGIIKPSFHSFLHLITLAYVTSWVLRPHDITHCVW